MIEIRRSALQFERDYTIIPNAWVRDPRLTLKAAGLLGRLLSHREGWRTSIKRLAAEYQEGADAIRSAVRELETYGYLHRGQDRDEQGRVGASFWELRDPSADPVTENPTTGEPVRENPGDGKIPMTGKPGTIRRPTSKEDQPSQEDYVSPPASKPKKAGSRGSRLEKGWMPDQPVIDQMLDECPGVDFEREHRQFVDYWISVPGQRGVKLDWNATWRNWIRRAAERGLMPVGAGGRVSGPVGPGGRGGGIRAASNRMMEELERLEAARTEGPDDEAH